MKLNNIPLRLDDRIFDIADIKTVITADENDVGKMGYFANSIHLFKNLEGLDGIKYGKLIYLSVLDYGGDKSDQCFVCSNQWAYRYFIPEDALKSEEPEKKYRPYKNAQELFEDIGVYIGDVIHFRRKDSKAEYHALITSHLIYTENGTTKICLGSTIYYTMQELFDLFELRSRDDWLPFGIEEQV